MFILILSPQNYEHNINMLLLMFYRSVRFGESISASKYSTYSDYQDEVSRIIPWFPCKISSMLKEKKN